MRFVNWYIGKLFHAAHDDAGLAEKFVRVANLLARPESLLAPGVALRVLLGNLAANPAPMPSPSLTPTGVTRH